MVPQSIEIKRKVELKLWGRRKRMDLGDVKLRSVIQKEEGAVLMNFSGGKLR